MAKKSAVSYMATFLLVMLAVILVGSLAGCGTSSSAMNDGLSTAPASNSGYVSMRFNLNESMAKTVYGGGLDVNSIIRSYMRDVAWGNVDVFAYRDGNQEGIRFYDMPIVNGIFDASKEDGTSLISLPEGEYIIEVLVQNQNNTTRFSGVTSLPVVKGAMNKCDVFLSLNSISFHLAITGAPNEFVVGEFYRSSSLTDDLVSYYGDQVAWMDKYGVLHTIVAINPLLSRTLEVGITNKDGKLITQKFDLDILRAVEADQNSGTYWHTYNTNEPVNITLTFPE